MDIFLLDTSSPKQRRETRHQTLAISPIQNYVDTMDNHRFFSRRWNEILQISDVDSDELFSFNENQTNNCYLQEMMSYEGRDYYVIEKYFAVFGGKKLLLYFIFLSILQTKKGKHS